MAKSNDTHPNRKQLCNFVQGRVSDAELTWIENHLEQCAPCCQMVEQVPTRDDLVSRLVDHLRKHVAPAQQDTGHDLSSYQSEAVPAAERIAFPDIPGYDILRELGRGGMGVVYQARQLGLNRLVGLKMLLHQEFANPEEMARFRREAETVASLEHPNIVQIHEIGTYKDLPFFSLEYCTDGSMDKYLNGTPLPPETAAELVQTLAGTMHLAHEQGIIHRDLKPANVLLQSTPEAKVTPKAGSDTPSKVSDLKDKILKITDFGLAKQLDQTGYTQSGAVMGTPSYMAPEQAQAKTSEMGPLVDVYALGAILYEFLTGRPPFKGPTPLDTLKQVINDEPVSVRHLQSSVPKDLETICSKCLQKHPSQRYDSAAALADDLRRYRSGEPVLARSIGPLTRLLRWCRRNRTVASFLVALFATMMIGTGVSLYFAARATHFSDVSDKKAAAADKARERESNERNKVEALYNVSLFGQAALYYEDNNIALALNRLEKCKSKYLGWEYGGLMTMCHKKLRLVGKQVPPLFHTRLSPDGTIIVSSSQHRIKAWRRETGQLLWSLQLPKHAKVYVLEIAIDAQSKRLAACYGPSNTFGPHSGQIKIWDLTTGEELLHFQDISPAVYSVDFHPNGQRLAAALSTGKVQVWDLSTKKELYSYGRFSKIRYSLKGKYLATVAPRGTIKIWDTAARKELYTFSVRSHAVVSICFSRNAKYFAAASLNGRINVWDLQSGKKIHIFKNSRHNPYDMAFSPDGKHLALAWGDESLQVLELSTHKKILGFAWRGFDTKSVNYTPDGLHLVTGDADGGVRVWGLSPDEATATLTGNTNVIRALCFHPKNRKLATLDDKEIKIWNIDKRKLDRSFEATRYPYTDEIYYSSDGQYLAFAQQNRTVKIINADSGKTKHILSGKGRRGIITLAFSPDGKHIAAAFTKAIVIVDLVSGKTVRSIRIGSPGPMCFHPDGRRLFTYIKKQIGVWDIHTGTILTRVPVAKTGSSRLCCSPDGAWLALGCRDGTIYLWNTDSGKLIDTLHRHKKKVTSLCFLGNNRLASSSVDRFIKIWNVTTGKDLLTLTGSTAPVVALACSADRRTLASSGTDKTIRLWEANRVNLADGKNVIDRSLVRDKE